VTLFLDSNYTSPGIASTGGNPMGVKGKDGSGNKNVEKRFSCYIYIKYNQIESFENV